MAVPHIEHTPTDPHLPAIPYTYIHTGRQTRGQAGRQTDTHTNIC